MSCSFVGEFREKTDVYVGIHSLYGHLKCYETRCIAHIRVYMSRDSKQKITGVEVIHGFI